MSIQSYIAENKLEWMIVFNARTDAHSYAYRGSLVVAPAKGVSGDKPLPPKEVIKQVLLATNTEAIDFLACELTTIDMFDNFFDRYRAYLTPQGQYLLFVCDINLKGRFVHEGITFYAYPLDESSVWNELLDFADLPKADLKKMSDKEKIDAVCAEMKRTTLRTPEKTLDELKAAKTGGKIFFGAG